MTRAERIAIRSERVKQRRIKMGLITDNNVVSAITTITPEIQEVTNTTTIMPVITEIPADGKWNIEICIHTYHYQKRLTWMLSSILQQKGDVPNLIINISHTDFDGDPTTAEVCQFFREKGLNIVETPMTKEEISNRAIARNRQTTNSTAHWLLYVDSDMVYEPYFFDDLAKKLKGEYKDVQVVMGSDRVSLDVAFSIKYFEEDKEKYPRVIPNVAEILTQWPVKWVTGAGTAPGNFQLVSVKVMKEKAGGLITGRAKDHWRNTRGDRALRVRLGGRKAIQTLKQYHLNHDRGGPDIQR